MMLAYCHRSEITLHIIHVDLDNEKSNDKFMLIGSHNKFIKNGFFSFFPYQRCAFFTGYDYSIREEKREQETSFMGDSMITKNTSFLLSITHYYCIRKSSNVFLNAFFFIVFYSKYITVKKTHKKLNFHTVEDKFSCTFMLVTTWNLTTSSESLFH